MLAYKKSPTHNVSSVRSRTSYIMKLIPYVLVYR